MTLAWKPSADVKTLRLRAKLIAQIREFFAARDVLEVETPLLSHATITDPHIQTISATFQGYGNKTQTLFLQTSPEYAMKRLLAAQIGSIYQICKAFRQDDPGYLHNPEFTVLEWYRLGFDHHDLMQEMDELLQLILNTKPATYFSYQQLFQHYLHINPHCATVEELSACAAQHQIDMTSALSDRDAWLSLLLTHLIEPQLGFDHPVFIYDFPKSQAALAKIRDEEPPVASRFELYFKGIELANGFHELLDVTEQRHRFNADLTYRKQQGLATFPLDERFLAALESGMPDCAGVALGIDRLIMLALQCQSIKEVLSFSFNEA
jgi:lysyl-tRNA synthetase class 2